MGTGPQRKPKYPEDDPKQVQAVREKFDFFTKERMRQRGQKQITLEKINETVYEYNRARNIRDNDEIHGLDKSYTSKLLNCDPLILYDKDTGLPRQSAKDNLRKIILVLVMNQEIISQDEATEFLQLIFPGDQLRPEYSLDREIIALLRENSQEQQSQPPLPPSAPPARRFTLTRHAFFIIGLVVIVVLATVVGSGLALRLRNGLAPAPSPTSTVAVALTPGPYGIPVGQSLLDDPLVTNTQVTNSGKRWQEGQSADHNGSCRFRTGGYDVKTTAYHTYCQDTTDVFINFVLQVDMSLIGQSEGGVLFRATLTGGGYYFGIDDLGNYEIKKTNSNNKQHIKQVINQDTPENTYDLIIVAYGSSFAIYINGKPLDHFDDPTYTGGYIALAVEGVAPPYTQSNTEVLFTISRCGNGNVFCSRAAENTFCVPFTRVYYSPLRIATI